MIALPIFGVAAADITIRSSDPSEEQQLQRDYGAADGRLSFPGVGRGERPVYQHPDGWDAVPVKKDRGGDAKQRDERPEPSDLKAVMPPGAHWLSDQRAATRVRTEHGVLRVHVRELKLADPMARGIATLLRGRYPKTTGEVAATQAFLDSSGLRVGSTLRPVEGGRAYRITGAYELPGSLNNKQLSALPGAMIRTDGSKPNDGVDRLGYLVSVPGAYTWDMVKETNTHGIVVTSKAVLLDPPPESEVPFYRKSPGMRPGAYEPTSDQALVLTIAVTVVGLAILEICLLAGPAFAVGARRQRRQLGLLGAQGGDRRHIRSVVLSGGLVIGVAAAVLGLALAIGATALARPLIEERLHTRFSSFDLPPLELAGIAGLAVLTGLLAALFPAIAAARQSVLSSLTGRRGVRRSSRVLPIVGFIAIGVGVAIAIAGATLTDRVEVVGIGSGIAELGLVALTPFLVGLFGRLGRILPLSPRLALRDAVRNRGRTAPAVAAVLAAVAGSVAVATYTASVDQQRRDEYAPSAPHGVVSVQMERGTGRTADRVGDAVEQNLKTTGRADVGHLSVGGVTCGGLSGGGSKCGGATVVVPEGNDCPLHYGGDEKLSAAERQKMMKSWQCNPPQTPHIPMMAGMDVLVGGTDVLKALGVQDRQAYAALERGHAVSFTQRYIKDDRITLAVFKKEQDYYNADDGDPDTTKKADRTIPLPAHHLRGQDEIYGVNVLLPPAAVTKAGLDHQNFGAYFRTDRLPTDAETQALSSAFNELNVNPILHVEKGYKSDSNNVLLALTLFAALVTLGAAGIATGLAQADAEPDLRTLAAVGAGTRVRRTLSGLQCGLIAAMGVVLGSIAGLIPAIGLRKAEERRKLADYAETLGNGWGGEPHIPIAIPWETLAGLLLVVPLGAALLAALVTRSRIPLLRRGEG
ncbi:FtsX-like permease family protein [Streptomyces sp. A7024]|uniref:FtsX-like permease family protein n=2 Tax=Streptomyces coryli TaxID=1128680 RepID=A0A6G4U6L8_9ACTN|nr:FtsX-like permease family protein [Streptomyces coryli]NGN67824.1 FtsX-like permease family protein [Streptomyces coryli]